MGNINILEMIGLVDVYEDDYFLSMVGIKL